MYFQSIFFFYRKRVRNNTIKRKCAEKRFHNIIKDSGMWLKKMVVKFINSVAYNIVVIITIKNLKQMNIKRACEDRNIEYEMY